MNASIDTTGIEVRYGDCVIAVSGSRGKTSSKAPKEKLAPKKKRLTAPREPSRDK